MPAHDLYHDAVKNALIKDGWTITHDPFRMEWGKRDMYVDLGAERLLAAERAGDLESAGIARDRIVVFLCNCLRSQLLAIGEMKTPNRAKPRSHADHFTDKPHPTSALAPHPT